MTNDKFFPGLPRFNRPPSSPGAAGRLVRQCEWDSASPLKFARALLGRAARCPSHPRSPWDEKNVSDADQENHKPCPAPPTASEKNPKNSWPPAMRQVI
jgi:hypothetical protein